MLKTLSAIATAAVIAAAIAVIPGFATQVDASTPIAMVKADRLDIRPIGKDCSQKAWPYFENNCLRKAGSRTVMTQSARLVAFERR
jgi:hypothetical protein